jgi:hypothetical protein
VTAGGAYVADSPFAIRVAPEKLATISLAGAAGSSLRATAGDTLSLPPPAADAFGNPVGVESVAFSAGLEGSPVNAAVDSRRECLAGGGPLGRVRGRVSRLPGPRP